MVPSVGFIGGGRITRVLLEGWRRAGRPPGDVVVSDTDAGALERLSAAFPEVVAARDDNERAARQDVTFLAVHPPAMSAVVGALRGRTGTATIIVSLAPKLSISDLNDLLGGFDRLARVIPNAASMVGAGFNPVAFSSTLAPMDRESLLSLLRVLGQAPEVPEADLEAYAVLTAMGPTYLWFQLYELMSLARSFGLSPGAADEAVASMAIGAVRTMRESGLTREEVVDLIPVRPLADEEEGWKAAYRARLRAVLDRIRPAAVV
jgi:pyrroline-5-carboxylate reductase